MVASLLIALSFAGCVAGQPAADDSTTAAIEAQDITENLDARDKDSQPDAQSENGLPRAIQTGTPVSLADIPAYDGTSYIQLENNMPDFTEEEKQEYKDMLVKIDNLAKYEVKEAKEDKDGNFTVTIEVTPSDVYQTLEDNSTAVAQEMMDQGQDVSQADASMFQDLLIQSMQKSIDGNTYGDTTTIEIAVTKDSDGQYGISDSDMEKISTALFPGSV